MKGYNQPVETYYYGPINLKVKDLTIKATVEFVNRRTGGVNNPLTGAAREEYREKIKESVEKVGLINPVIVAWHLHKRKIDSFIVEQGGDRVKVFKELGKETIPCYLKIYWFRDRGEMELFGMKICEMVAKIIPLVKVRDGENYDSMESYKKWDGDID